MSKIDPRIGLWETGTGDSALIIEIKAAGKTLKVGAFDKHDGERFVVRRCRFVKRNEIHFTVFVPSERYATENKMTFRKDGSVLLAYTICENWRRVPAGKITVPPDKVKRKRALKHN